LADFLFFDPSNEPHLIPSQATGRDGQAGMCKKTVHTLEQAETAMREGTFEAVLFHGPTPDLPLLASRFRDMAPGIPLVFLFGETQGQFVGKMLREGIDSCLCTEGLTWQDLQETIRHAADRKQALGKIPLLENDLADARLDVESHRKAYRRISDDLRSAVKALASMGEFNRLFFHAEDEKSTIRNFCRVLVKGHGYRMAWVGSPEATADGLEILPISHAGDEQGFLANPFPGKGDFRPILEGHPWVIQDIKEEAGAHGWSQEALKRNYRSVAALPFGGTENTPMLVLCVFAGKEGAFSADRLAMLVDMTKMLSGGLRILGEKLLQQANKATLELMNLAVKTSVSGFVIFSLEEGIQYVNDAALELAGYSSREEVLGFPYRDFVQVNEKTPEVLRTVFGGGNWTGEFDLIRKDGSLREVFSSVSAIRNKGHEVLSVLVSFIDLSEKKKTEQDLHQSRALYEAIIKDQTDMILRFLPETLEITYANLPYARYYGMEVPEAFIGQSFCCRYTTEQEDLIREHLRKLTPVNPVRQIEEQVVLPGGETRWQQWVDRGIFDSAGNLVEVQGVGRDITDLKTAQEELLREKARLETLFENSPDGIVFCTTDQVVETANMAFQRLFGYTASEISGKNIDDLLLKPPEEQAAALELNMTGHDGITRSLEGTRIGKSGVPVFVSVTVIPRTELDGRLSGTYAIYRDLTERRQKEEALKISNTIIEGSPAIVFRWKAEKGWPIEYVSENIRQFGYTPEELTAPGFFYRSIIHPDDLGRVTAESASLDLEKREVFSFQYRIILKSGETRWVVERNRPERDSTGRLVRHLGVVMDDTERRKAEIEARVNHEALQNSLQQLEISFRKTIEVLSSTTEARDPYTAGHQRKVATLSEAIARRMGLPEKTCEGIYLAAMVHDVGKISIPAELLSKPSKLNEVEMALIQTHPEAAYEILKNVDSPWNLAEVVRQHHERMDGTGYPMGLVGDEILIEARILAVADVFEAVASDRPYRPGLGLEAAMAAIEEGRGTEFDAKVVDTCRTLYNEGFEFDDGCGRFAFATERRNTRHA
jgi:PAS domain S-box-containing protein